MDDRSVCVAISSNVYEYLRKEVTDRGQSAINNRMNLAARLRKGGDLKGAEIAEQEAREMRNIAEARGIKL